ncbi:MAG: M20/M25/M40 family metallo-hydrolase [Clostridia bacterium]|nr:M20/M25/M40 family metallo-hydrolase [Clostridia bacterium]
MLLKDLCERSGVSGDEKEIRDFIKSQISGCACLEDTMGNLLVSKGGKGKRILLAAHMDEVGLMISGIEDNGFLRFKTVGGINSDVLLGKKVYIGKDKVSGIIGVCAVHLQSKAQREETIKEENMYIDIGALDREEAEKVVMLGDTAVFPPHYEEFGDGLIDAKAIDDRAGCAVILRLLKNTYPGIELVCAFTAQEEVGTRGAQAAAEYFRPDYAVVVESTFCSDIFPTEPHLHVTTLGKGPAVTFMDRVATPDRALISSITLAAKENDIPWQQKRTAGGGTDAGVIMRAVEGIPTAILALPCRNLHSPSLVIAKDDYESLYRLLDVWLRTVAPSL